MGGCEGGEGGVWGTQDLLSLHLDLMAGDVSKDISHICLIYFAFF